MLCPTALSPFIRAMGGGYLVGSVEVPHLVGKKYILWKSMRPETVWLLTFF